MKQIESFTVNHLKLLPGLYVSRRDERDGVCVTTFDLRITQPNVEPVMDTAAIHTMEHIGATFLRNSPHSDDIVYFGPMGCKTGFYLIVFGRQQPADVLSMVKDTFRFISTFEGDIPGASPVECGNYSLQNIDMARYYAAKYLRELDSHQSFVYQT